MFKSGCPSSLKFGRLPDTEDAQPRPTKKGKVCMVAGHGASFFFGVFVTIVGIALSGAWTGQEEQTETLVTARWSVPKTPGRNLTFFPTRAGEVLGDLSTEEIRNTAMWFLKKTGGTPVREKNPDDIWLSGPSGLELLHPPKADVLAYIDGLGPKPPRYARLTAMSPDGVMEYKAGPLVNGAPTVDATLVPLFDKGDVPYAKRPTEPNADVRLGQDLIDAIYLELQPLLLKAFGNIWPSFQGYDGSEGTALLNYRNNALSPPGTRLDLVMALWMPPPPYKLEAFWMHPIPIEVMINTTEKDVSKWTLKYIKYCKQDQYETAKELMDAYAKGLVQICPFERNSGPWDVPTQETPPSTLPRTVELNHGVSWGHWNFTVTARPSTGLAMVDIKFKDERILYELSLQDAHAAYSGTMVNSFFYSDSSWSLSMLSASLEPGVDCPEGAHYLKVSNWYDIQPGGGAETRVDQPFEFLPVCVFEWDEDHTLWRHMQNSNPTEVHGLVRKTVVVRSICTIANYDYITDIKFREDGEIEVSTKFAGYIESRYFRADLNPEERNFSTVIGPNLAGPVHSHLVNFKADFDIAGNRENTFRLTKVGTMPVPTPIQPDLVSKALYIQDVQQEGVGLSTFVADPKIPTVWSVVDRSAMSAVGNPRGYAIVLDCWANLQVLPDNHPFTVAMPWTKYHVAVTKYHDDEYRVNSPYVHYDGYEKVKNGQDLDRFLENGESLVDVDLVTWIGLGREHIVRQEDQPLVSNFGVAFSLVPWNFFERNVAASPLAFTPAKKDL